MAPSIDSVKTSDSFSVARASVSIEESMTPLEESKFNESDPVAYAVNTNVVISNQINANNVILVRIVIICPLFITKSMIDNCYYRIILLNK